MNFSYFTFLHHPIPSLGFIALILAFISLWIHKRTWLWGTFLAISFVFAFYGKLIDFKVFIFLVFLAASCMALATKVRGWLRASALFIAFISSLAFISHIVPGFHNWKLMEEVHISKNAYPYTLYLNYDKPFVGFFPLAFTIPLLQTRFQFRTIMLKAIMLSIVGVMIMIILSLYFQVVDIDLKFPHSWFIFLIANLFFVAIPEEAFFRGLLQSEIHEIFHKKKWSGILSIILVSILFATLHLGFVKDINFISLAFIASVIYGTVYHLTRCIESSIFCHYLFNILHFFCFTYPALKI